MHLQSTLFRLLSVLRLSVRLPSPRHAPVMTVGSHRLMVGRQSSAKPSVARWASYGNGAVARRLSQIALGLAGRLQCSRVAAARTCLYRLICSAQVPAFASLYLRPQPAFLPLPVAVPVAGLVSIPLRRPVGEAAAAWWPICVVADWLPAALVSNAHLAY